MTFMIDVIIKYHAGMRGGLPNPSKFKLEERVGVSQTHKEVTSFADTPDYHVQWPRRSMVIL